MKEYKRQKNSNTYLINCQLYTLYYTETKNANFKPAFTKNGRTYYIEQTDLRQVTATTTKPFNNTWLKRIVQSIQWRTRV